MPKLQFLFCISLLSLSNFSHAAQIRILDQANPNGFNFQKIHIRPMKPYVLFTHQYRTVSSQQLHLYFRTTQIDPDVKKNPNNPVNPTNQKDKLSITIPTGIDPGTINGNLSGNNNSGVDNGNINGNSNIGSLNGNINGNNNTGDKNGQFNGNQNQQNLNGNMNGNSNSGSNNGNTNGNQNNGAVNGNINGNNNESNDNGNYNGNGPSSTGNFNDNSLISVNKNINGGSGNNNGNVIIETEQTNKPTLADFKVEGQGKAKGAASTKITLRTQNNLQNGDKLLVVGAEGDYANEAQGILNTSGNFGLGNFNGNGNGNTLFNLDFYDATPGNTDTQTQAHLKSDAPTVNIVAHYLEQFVDMFNSYIDEKKQDNKNTSS